MDYKETAEAIKNQDMAQFLKQRGIPTKGLTSCPFCKKGKNTGCASFYKQGNRFKCFSCDGIFSVLDFIALDNGVEPTGEGFFKAVEAGAELFGLALEKTSRVQKQDKIERNMTQAPEDLDRTTEGKDYTQYLEECRARLTMLEAQAYIKERCLSPKVCERFGVGFDPKEYGFSKLIIPCEVGYFARATQSDDKVQKKNSEGGNGFFNVEALTSKDPIFIVEGAIDALSIETLGYKAIGIGGTSGVTSLAQKCEEKNKKAFLLLALDNDEAGRKATRRLTQELSKRRIRFKDVSQALYGSEHKDANECLCEELGAFKDALKEAFENPLTAEEEKARDAYIANTQGAQFISELSAIHKRERAFFPTGFKRLDGLLDGGLYEGLYVLGAISSLGKTAFVLQVADQIAETGQDVLIFSLEMAKTELVGRSVSRITMQKASDLKRAPRSVAWTYREITSPTRYEEHETQESGAILCQSLHDYEKGAGEHIFIVEGSGDIKVTCSDSDEDCQRGIRQMLQEHITKTGHKPIVVIDYLQMLAPMNERATDKQNMDKATLELKRLSRDYGLPIIAISSFNRGSYANGATMSSFKESGAIEYTADVLIGLSLKGMEDLKDNPSQKEVQQKENELKSDVDVITGENKRQISLTILKNRNGATGVSVTYEYRPKYSFFRELTQQEEES